MQAGGGESCRPLHCEIPAKPHADRAPALVWHANRASMTATISSAAARNSGASTFGPNAGSLVILPVLPSLCCGSAVPLIRPEQTRAAAYRRHVGEDDGSGSARCSRLLRAFVTLHDTMPIALSPRLCRPCLLAFWRQPMGSSVPLKTVASNYFPRPPAPRLRRAPRAPLRSK